MLVWVSLPMVARIGQGKEKVRLALREGTAHSTASPRNSCLGPFRNTQWVLQALLQPVQTGEQSQRKDLQASANLLCICADCCNFTPCW